MFRYGGKSLIARLFVFKVESQYLTITVHYFWIRVTYLVDEPKVVRDEYETALEVVDSVGECVDGLL